jgi:hypothetical protein
MSQDQATIFIHCDRSAVRRNLQTVLPVGVTQVGAAIGLPAAFKVTSITYGSTDLLRQSLNVSLTETAELVITLTKSAP